MVQADKGVATATPEPHTAPADIGQFDEFFDTTYPLLIKIALVAGASFEEAEDAANETMIDVYQRWAEIRSPQPYARTALRRRLTKWGQRDRERLVRTIAGGHVTSEANIDDALNLWEDLERVRTLLDRLPPAQRAVMACVVDDIVPAEIAVLLGKTEATVRKHMQLARDALRRILAEEQQQPPAGSDTTVGKETQ